MKDLKDYAIKCVRSDLGNANDNLHRAQLAAKGADPQQQWGESGQTLQQIIDGYADWKAKAEATIAWLEGK